MINFISDNFKHYQRYMLSTYIFNYVKVYKNYDRYSDVYTENLYDSHVDTSLFQKYHKQIMNAAKFEKYNILIHGDVDTNKPLLIENKNCNDFELLITININEYDRMMNEMMFTPFEFLTMIGIFSGWSATFILFLYLLKHIAYGFLYMICNCLHHPTIKNIDKILYMN